VPQKNKKFMPKQSNNVTTCTGVPKGLEATHESGAVAGQSASAQINNRDLCKVISFIQYNPNYQMLQYA